MTQLQDLKNSKIKRHITAPTRKRGFGVRRIGKKEKKNIDT